MEQFNFIYVITYLSIALLTTAIAASKRRLWGWYLFFSLFSFVPPIIPLIVSLCVKEIKMFNCSYCKKLIKESSYRCNHCGKAINNK